MRGARPRRRVNNRVRELRQAQGWTQAELAQRLNVSRQTVIAIEGDYYDASLKLALRMGRLFGVPVEKIFVDGEARP